MSEDTLDVRLLGTLMRQLQIDVREIGTKLDILTLARERDLSGFATHADLRDMTAVLARQIAGLEQGIDGIAQSNRRLEQMLAAIHAAVQGR